jgi:hypothetical protein
MPQTESFSRLTRVQTSTIPPRASRPRSGAMTTTRRRRRRRIQMLQNPSRGPRHGAIRATTTKIQTPQSPSRKPGRLGGSKSPQSISKLIDWMLEDGLLSLVPLAFVPVPASLSHVELKSFPANILRHCDRYRDVPNLSLGCPWCDAAMRKVWIQIC